MVSKTSPSLARRFVLDTFDRYHSREFLSPDPLEGFVHDPKELFSASVQRPVRRLCGGGKAGCQVLSGSGEPVCR